MAHASPIVLYIEDEEFDRFLMDWAFATAGLGASLRTVNDGKAAIGYLAGDGEYADREKYPVPDLILLDLNLPEVPGFEVLKWIRLQPAHADIPVVVFTSSPRDDDRLRARVLGASDFVQKPGSGLSFCDVVRQLHERWLSRAEPKHPASSPAPHNTATILPPEI